VASAHTPGVHAAIARAKLEWECTVDALRTHLPADRSGQVLRINRVCERWNLARSLTYSGAGCTMYCTQTAARPPASSRSHCGPGAEPAGRGSSGV